MKSIEELSSILPPIFQRCEIGRLTGGTIKPGTMKNNDSLGIGVKGRFRIGRKIYYSRTEFIHWLKSKIEDPNTRS